MDILLNLWIFIDFMVILWAFYKYFMDIFWISWIFYRFLMDIFSILWISSLHGYLVQFYAINSMSKWFTWIMILLHEKIAKYNIFFISHLFKSNNIINTPSPPLNKIILPVKSITILFTKVSAPIIGTNKLQ